MTASSLVEAEKTLPSYPNAVHKVFEEDELSRDSVDDEDIESLVDSTSTFEYSNGGIDSQLPLILAKMLELMKELRRVEKGDNSLNGMKVYKEYTLESFHKEERVQTSLLNVLEKRLSRRLEGSNGHKLTEDSVVRCLLLFERMSVLCVLGLKLDLLDGLEEKMPPEHYNHRTLCEWIEMSLEESIESLDSVHKNSLTPQLLASIGFDPSSKAAERIMVRCSAASTQQHIEACEWAQIFIADEFKYNPLLSSSSDKFPFKSSLTNTWFHLDPNEVDESENNFDDISRVNVMNVVTEKRLLASIQETFLDDKEHVFLFHGTDHESAKNILAVRGIYLNAGRQKRDFSYGKGFYLSKSIDDALHWAKSTTSRPAVLIFKANCCFLECARKLDLFHNDKRWREIVCAFRSGRRTVQTRRSLSSYDMIEGPMATVSRSETSDELVVEPKPSSYQMCVTSNEFAEKFQQTLHSVLFFGNTSGIAIGEANCANTKEFKFVRHN